MTAQRQKIDLHGRHDIWKGAIGDALEEEESLSLVIRCATMLGACAKWPISAHIVGVRQQSSLVGQ